MNKSEYQVMKVSPGGSLTRTFLSTLETILSASDKSQGQISVFGPYRLLVQTVQTSTIMQNSGRVSPPPSTRITTPYIWHVSASEQAKALYCECSQALV